MFDNLKVMVSEPLLWAVQGGLDHIHVELLPVIRSLGMASHLPFSAFWPDIELPPGLSQRDLYPTHCGLWRCSLKEIKRKFYPRDSVGFICLQGTMIGPEWALAKPGYLSVDKGG